jgi:hypothetical protein
MIESGKKYLITSTNWFVGPDGNQYRAAYGHAVLFEAKKELGFVPTRSANWYVKIGSKKNHHILIAGCQIHYFLRTDERPTQLPGTYTDKDSQRKFCENQILFLD